MLAGQEYWHIGSFHKSPTFNLPGRGPMLMGPAGMLYDFKSTSHHHTVFSSALHMVGKLDAYTAIDIIQAKVLHFQLD